MINVVIVEDDLFFLTFLESGLAKLGKYQVVGVADSVINAYNIIRAKSPDIVISDISLKGKNNGLELGHLIKDRNIPILYITESQDAKIYHQAEEIPLSSFLIKPFHILTLDSTINSLFTIKKASVYVKGLVYTVGGVKQLIANEEILYIEADKNYSMVYTEKGKFAFKLSIVKMMEKLQKNLFLRVHKSYVINLHKIRSFSLTDSNIHIENHNIPIGRTYKKDVLEYLGI